MATQPATSSAATRPARISAATQPARISEAKRDKMIRGLMKGLASHDASVCIRAIIAFSDMEPPEPSTATQPAKTTVQAPGDNLLVTTAKIASGSDGLVILDRDTGRLVTYRFDPAARRLDLISARDTRIIEGIAARRPGARTALWDTALGMVSGALDDDNPSVREHAAWALGRIGRRAALSDTDLRGAAKDRDPFVRDAATRALGRIVADPPGEWLADAKPPSTPWQEDVRQYAIELKSESSRRRLDAALALFYRAGKPSLAVDTLAGALDDKSGDIAFRAAVVLAEIGPPAKAVRSALNAATRHKDRSVRQAASLALETIVSSSSDLSSKHRKRLDDILVDRKISLAIVRLTSEDPVTRVLAGRELARHGARSVTALQEALKGGNEELVPEVVYVLGRIGKPAIDTLLKLLRDKETIVPAFAAAALVDMGKPAVSGLIAALKDPDAVMRQTAAEALGRIGPEAAQADGALTEASRDDNADVRKEAAAALKKIRREGK